MREGFSHYGPEALQFHQKPGDVMSTTPEIQPRVLRHETPYGELSFDPSTGKVISPLLPGKVISFGRWKGRGGGITNQRKVLEALMRNSTRVLSAATLLQAMWGEVPDGIDKKAAEQNVREAFSKLRMRLGENPKIAVQRDGKILFNIPARGYTLLSPAAALNVDHEQTYRRTTPHGEIRYNHEALVASSPYIDQGKTPVILSPQEGELLKRLLSHSGTVAIESLNTVFHSTNGTRVIVNLLRKKLGDKNIGEGSGSSARFTLLKNTLGGYRIST